MHKLFLLKTLKLYIQYIKITYILFIFKVLLMHAIIYIGIIKLKKQSNQEKCWENYFVQRTSSIELSLYII